jgi:hypothetical protein
MPKPPKSADQGDSDDPAQTSKEALAKIAEEDDQDGTEEPMLPKRGGLPPENDPPAA